MPHACKPSLETKESGVSDRDINDLMDGNLSCLKQGPGATPRSVLQTLGRTENGRSLCYWGRSKYPVTGEIDIRLAKGFPGKQQSEMPLTVPHAKDQQRGMFLTDPLSYWINN